MSKRERNMVIGLLSILVFGGGAFGGYTLVYDPLQAIYSEQEKLEDEINGNGTPEKPGLEYRVVVMRKAMPEVAAFKRESLPPNIDTAKDQYTHLLQRILEKAKVNDVKVPEAKVLESRAPVIPELGPKKYAYTRLLFHIEMNKVNIWQVADFLQDFYRLDLLHQITELDIVRQNKPYETRGGLQVRINIEAIKMDGADERVSLFPLAPSGKLNSTGATFAAVGGGPLVPTVATQPPLGSGKPVLSRLVTVRTEPPILAQHPRDYRFLPLNDIFYGVLHPSKLPPGIEIAFPGLPPLKKDQRFYELQIKPGQRIPDIKVKLTGDEVDETKLTAVVGFGTMLPDGPLDVDQKTHVISFPEPKEVSGRAYNFVTVKAILPDGKEGARAGIKVAYAGDDIASAIKLSLVSESDGAYIAQILDIATPIKYTITSTPQKGIDIVKNKLEKRKEWTKDSTYKQPRGILAISDDSSSTRRTFKVLAIEDNGMIVQEIADGGVAKDLYRWVTGKTLLDLTKSKIPADEAKKILKTVAETQPAGVPEVAGK